MNPILVVGSVALDSVKSPEGESSDALGGSAVYFSLAARHFAPVRLVGVVGEDFPARHREMLRARGIDVSGLETTPGKTFRWAGKYGRDFNSAETLATHLNVFEKFNPKLSAVHRESPIVFLANIDPELQWEVLSQIKSPKLVAADTMNFWIRSKKPALKELLAKVDVLFVNEIEAQELAGDPMNVRAAARLCEWGPAVVIVKKGEHGALMLAGGKVYPFPAYPVSSVKDPTGAGDSFAGAFIGSLAAEPDLGNTALLKRSLAWGAVMSSFNVSGFGTSPLEELDRAELDERHRDYAELLNVPVTTSVL